MSWVRPLRLFPAWRSLLWDVKEVGKRQSWALKVGLEGVRQGLYKDTHPSQSCPPAGQAARGQAGRRGELTMAGGMQAGCCREGPRSTWNPEGTGSSGQSQLRPQLCDLGQVGSLPQAPRAPTLENRGTAPTLQGFEKTCRARSGVFDKRQHLPQPSLHTQGNNAGQTQARLAASHPTAQVQPGPGPQLQGFLGAFLGPRSRGSGLDPAAQGKGQA